ncbi:MAG: DUF1775 domain-containing protein [Acidimicrobiales bacterium]
MSRKAHALFVGAPSGYPTNTDQNLTLNVPHERDDVTYNVAVSVRIPMSWAALSYQSKPTWTCSIDVVGGRQVFRFTKNPGAEVAEDETFQFAVRTGSTVGSFPFETTQTYNTGEVVSWIGAAGTERPAPMLSTVAGGTTPQTTPSTTNPDAPTTTSTVFVPPPTSVATTSATPTTAVPATTAGGGTTTTSPGTTTASTTTGTTDTFASSTTATTPLDDDDGGSGVPVAALIAALVLAAAGGGMFAFRRQRSATQSR